MMAIISDRKLSPAELFIRQAKLEPAGIDFSNYPFTIPAVRDIEQIVFNAAVTFVTGENGSGKSTILEAIAVAAGFNAEGGTKNYSFSTASTVSHLHRSIRLVRGARKEQNGFFLRAESFYNVSSEADRLEVTYGGKSLHAQSHGESFLHLANHRFGPHGLYILDEPEAALSPEKQLSFLKRMHDLARQGSQFLIATHSAMLLAYPGAAIYQLDQRGVSLVTYETTKNYTLTLDFLLHHEVYLKHLFENNEPKRG